ncbi:invasin [Yersinia massiliensis]|uniref:adhesion domain-containing protein n=1 Tax=Yersinia massiliensis TaxID=419257 RepID=UPI0005DD3A1B|nr:DUF823 domain-containing adhesin [Yersinia massiliensis]CNI38725.1 invasin [Yersinia massiliensis]
MSKTKTGTARSWLRGIMLAVAMALVTGPTLAVLSDSTDRIHGTPPTGTVTLQALHPDGTTVVANNAALGWTLVPNQFSVSPTVDNPILSDADEDTGLSANVNPSTATLGWSHNGTALTPAQLAAPLGNNFAGETLALTVEAPVTFLSVTGLPAMSAPLRIATPYTVSVDVPPLLSIELDNDSAFVEGGVINMTITTRDASGSLAPGTNVNVGLGGSVDRQGNSSGWTNNDFLLLDGTPLSSGLIPFTTGANGQVEVAVTHPGGAGVKTTIVAIEAGSATAISADVTFSILTSPDAPLARMFGHMSETITANGVTFKRPNLDAEMASDGSAYPLKNERWGRYTQASAIGRICGSESNLPTMTELLDLYAVYPSDSLAAVHGWPTTVFAFYRSSTVVSEGDYAGNHYGVEFSYGNYGHNGPNSDMADDFVMCH